MTFQFTVFTPTFNRAHTLPRVYRSLCAQIFRDFEWLIVDDGSTDNTATVVERWQAEARFPIRYVRQENSGKPAAFNLGVFQAHGELFLNLDSDDECVPEALDRLKFWWDAIPEQQKPHVCGVTALCKRPDGTPVGEGFPRDIMDCSTLDMNYRYGCRFEKWGFIRTDVLRLYPFPVIPGEKFIAESLVWNRVGLRYQTRFVNERLRVYHTTVGSLNGAARRNPKGASLYYRELASMPIPGRWRVGACLNFVRYLALGQSDRSKHVSKAQ